MSENINVKKTSMKSLIAHMKNCNEIKDKRFCFILGAGASKQSKILTGNDLAKQWMEELKNLYDEDELVSWKKQKDINDENVAQKYCDIYEKRFELEPLEGYYYLQKVMKDKNPSFGYSVLVQMLTSTNNNVVITTNFDSLVEDAMFIYTKEKPLVCGHESLAGFIKPIMDRPLIAKIHRDLLFDPKNTKEGTSNLSNSWREALINVFKFYTPIVIGYGGNDGSLMGFLNDIDKINGTLFWCYWNGGQEPDNEVKGLISKHAGYLVPIDGFDEFFIHVSETYGYETLDNIILKVAQERADTYNEQFDDLSKNLKVKKVIENIIKKDLGSWRNLKLEIEKITDRKEREVALFESTFKFPDIYELKVDYLKFLKYEIKDYNKAEEYYKKLIKSDTNNIKYLRDYAEFLTRIRREYNEAEKYYLKAIEVDTKNPISVYTYIVFLETNKKDYDKAEEYYKKAIDLFNRKGFILSSYAEFLEMKRKDYDKAEEYYKKAIEQEPEDSSHITRYISFLEKNNKNYNVIEKYYQKAVDLNPKKVYILMGYAGFLANRKADYDKAEEYYKMAAELNSEDSEYLIECAEFLANKRYDYDKAEEYYKKAIEIDSDDSYNICCYAEFLANKREDYEKAEDYYKKAIEVDLDNGYSICCYAEFLANKREDYNKAEDYYEKAIEVDSDDGCNICNYAEFLEDKRKDYDKAEEYYKEAIELEPEDDYIILKYAEFLNHKRQDYNKAESYYKRAVELNANDEKILAAYDKFLQIKKKN